MKVLKVMLTIMMLGAVSIFSLSCGSEAGESGLSENQIATVQRGNLTIDVTAVGNLALSRTEDLAFEIAGTVEEVLIEEGESAEEGQVLARLDTSEWEDYIETLKDKLTAAERTLATKQRAVTTAERNLTAKQRAVTTAERQVTTKERAVTTAERTLSAKERAVATKELALRSAQISLQTAEYNLNQIAEVKKAQDAVDDAEYQLRITQAMWEKALKSEASGGEVSYWFSQLTFYKARLAEAEQERREVLAESSVRVTTEVAIEIESKKLAVEQAQQGIVEAQVAIEDAQIALDTARTDVEDAQIALDDARTDVEDAQKDIEDARKALDEALKTSPEILAPFDGFVTKVSVEGGDEVLKGTVAVVIADPTKFEADILVSEMDILQVKVGGEAWMQVDAVSGLRLPAKVTHISPTASIQQGVVNYKVKVELQPMEAVMQERQQERQGTTGEMPERLRQAIEEGRITQQQIEEMMKQRQQGQGTQQRQVPTMLPENFQLRQGLTVTVSIIVKERNNVLLVPNSAITAQSGQTLVQVLKDGITETRAITTGISNWQYTEVTEGLSEGEQVVIPQGSTATTPTTQQRPPRGMFIPGMGR